MKNAYQHRRFAPRSATALLATRLIVVKKKSPEPAQGVFIGKRKGLFDGHPLFYGPGI
jgi:hypothetical protein